MMQAPARRGLFWLGFIALIVVFLYETKAILPPFVIGMLAAYLLDPSADKLERAGLSRTWATTVITISFFLVVILLIAAIVPLLSQQIAELVTTLPTYAQDLAERYGDTIHKLMRKVDAPADAETLGGALGNISGVMASITGGLLTGLFHSGLAFVNIVSLLLITPVVVFYLLRDWDKMVAHIDSLLPRAHAEVIRQQLDEIDRRIAGFVRGQFTVMMILAAFYGIALTLAGLRFGLIIGLVSGLLIIIPYLGVFVGMLASVGMALVQFDELERVGIVLGIYIFGQVVEGNFITPKLVGDRVGLHPVWLIFGLLAGGTLFGFVGVLLAVPVTAIIGVLVRFAITQYRMSGLYRGDHPHILPVD